MKRVRQGYHPCFFVFLALAALWVQGGAALAEGLWTEESLPPVSPMNAVSFSNRANAWAVGDQGNILQYANRRWNIFPSSTDKDLFAVFSMGTNNAWAVGAEGTIMHWDGDRWAVRPESGSVTSRDLYAVAFLNESNGWASGGGTTVFGGGDQAGVVLHYDGTSWSKVQDLSYTVTGIAAVSSDYIWFCGYNRSLTLFNGAVFSSTSFETDGKAWRAISFPYRRLGWVVGDGGEMARFSPGKYPAGTYLGWGTYYVDSLGVASPSAQGYAPGATADLYGVGVLSDPEWGYAVGAGGIRLRLDEDLLFRQEATGGEVLLGIGLPNHEEGAAIGGSPLSGPRAVMLRKRTVETGFPNTRIFPNPFEPLKGGMVTIDRLPENVSGVDIFTMEGDKIASFGDGIIRQAAWGVAFWEGKVGGKPAASGAYLVRLSAPGVKSRIMSFLVVKR